jgi:hypothetical protein
VIPTAPPRSAARSSNFCDKKMRRGRTFPAGEGASNRGASSPAELATSTARSPIVPRRLPASRRSGSPAPPLTAERMVKALEGPAAATTASCVMTRCSSSRSSRTPMTTDSLGTVESWKKALQDAKGGDDDAFALLVLTTDVDVGYQQLCLPNEYNTQKNPLDCSSTASSMASSARSARPATSSSSPRPSNPSSISAKGSPLLPVESATGGTPVPWRRACRSLSASLLRHRSPEGHKRPHPRRQGPQPPARTRCAARPSGHCEDLRVAIA